MKRSTNGGVRIEDLLESAVFDAAEFGVAYLDVSTLRTMARAARELREELRRSRVRQHVLADALDEYGVTVPADFLSDQRRR